MQMKQTQTPAEFQNYSWNISQFLLLSDWEEFKTVDIFKQILNQFTEKKAVKNTHFH